MTDRNYDVEQWHDKDGRNGVPVKMWTRGVQLEEQARQQLHNAALLPFIYKHIAVMPDVHWGMGATIGSVIPTKGAIIPAAVGVDIGCGMMALRTSLTANDLPDSLSGVRLAIEAAVPHGGPGVVGSWADGAPLDARIQWDGLLRAGFAELAKLAPKIAKGATVEQLGTLGTGNHFIEICLDEDDRVWVMLHSGSRGVGNRIGTYFIELAKQDMRRFFVNLPDADLAYLPEGTEHFDQYVLAVGWAQRFAWLNREIMMSAIVRTMRSITALPVFGTEAAVVHCHHNYVERESHFGENVWVTRKGAVRAREGDLGIIPGSMGTRSYIVAGKGNPESFMSCSHGAGRAMSRGEAKRTFSLEDHAAAVAGVECRLDAGVIDETPGAYKPIDAVMAAQADLVEIVHELRQVVCVKG